MADPCVDPNPRRRAPVPPGAQPGFGQPAPNQVPQSCPAGVHQQPQQPQQPKQQTQSMTCFDKKPQSAEEREKEEQEKEEELEKKREDIAKAYRVIMTDPRYLRIVRRTAPKTFSVQKLKQQVDPASIPVFGTFVKGYRSFRVEKHKDTMDLAQVAGEEECETLAPALSAMDLNVKAEANKRHIGLAVGMLFSVVPVASVTPVGSAGGSAASAAVAKGTSEGIEEGIKKGAQKAGEKSQLHKMDSDNYEALVHKKYLMTKSFLLYIGDPKTDDELYNRWEECRLKLKNLYGAKDEEDLPRLQPTAEQKKMLREARKQQEETGNGMYDLQAMGVSLLWLMWEMYECWDCVYFDWVHGKVKMESQEEFLNERNAKDRLEDEEYLASLTLASNPLIRRVSNVETDRVVALMMQCSGGEFLSPRMNFVEDVVPEKKEEAKTWYCTTVAEYFMKNNEIWGVEDPETLLLKAVVLLEQAQGDRPRPFSVTGLAKAATKIGTGATKTLKATNKLLNDTRDNFVNKKDNSAQFIHFVGGYEEHIQDDENVRDLIMAVQQAGATEGKATGTHMFEYAKAPTCLVLEKANFKMVGEKDGIRFYTA